MLTVPLQIGPLDSSMHQDHIYQHLFQQIPADPICHHILKLRSVCLPVYASLVHQAIDPIYIIYIWGKSHQPRVQESTRIVINVFIFKGGATPSFGLVLKYVEQIEYTYLYKRAALSRTLL